MKTGRSGILSSARRAACRRRHDRGPSRAQYHGPAAVLVNSPAGAIPLSAASSDPPGELPPRPGMHVANRETRHNPPARKVDDTVCGRSALHVGVFAETRCALSDGSAVASAAGIERGILPLRKTTSATTRGGVSANAGRRRSCRQHADPGFHEEGPNGKRPGKH